MIFIDSNIPMYMVGAPHPNRDRALELVTQLAQQEEELLTSIEVYQEVLHRYTAIQRWEAVDAAFRVLDSVIDRVVSFDIPDILTAKTLVETVRGMSARDALHVAVMRKAGTNRILSFDAGFDSCPGVERIF